MADVPVPGYRKFWTEERTSLKAEYQVLITKHPDADAHLKQLLKILCDTEDVAGYTQGADWSSIVNTAEEIRANYCKALTGEPHLVPCTAHIR
jgi:hypothetical protein